VRATALFRLSPSAIVAMDTEGRVTSLNAAAERLLAPNAGDAIGKPYTDVLGPSLADRMVGLAMRVARSKASSEPQIVRATLPDGRRVMLRASAGPLLDEARAFIGLVLVAEDETETEDAKRDAQQRGIEGGRLRDALARYVGGEVAAAVEARPSFIGVGGVRQAVSVLHGDVRGYTTVAEGLEPEKVLDLLLRYHGEAVAALQAEGATIDRFIGDAILALWNAPAAQPDHTRRAFRGALALQRAVKAVGSDLAYGIGIHTGEAVVGNLGSDRYMNYTAIGDTVNVAARLQSAAAAGAIVCSGAALRAAGAGVSSTPLGELTVKGRRAPVEAYVVEGLDG
jgi:PAS domain S-box-containing protein